jgi:hypothetical protein
MVAFTVVMTIMSVGIIFLGVIELTDHYVKITQCSKKSSKKFKNIDASSLLIHKH